MVAQSQQYRQQGGSQNPPALLSFQAEQSQKEKEDAYGTKIHRTGSKWLRPVVGIHPVVVSQMRRSEFVFLQRFRRFAVGRKGSRSAAVVVRNHQVRQLLPAVAPGRGVAEVQAFALFGAGSLTVRFVHGTVFSRLRGAAASHRILGVVPGGDEFGGVRADADESEGYQQSRNQEKPSHFLPADQQVDQRPESVGHDDNSQIVGYLRMVRLHLEAHRQGEEGRPQQGSRPFF